MLAQAGLGSRRALEERIAQGLVKVNGEVAQTGLSVGSGDRIELDGKVFVASALTEPGCPSLQACRPFCVIRQKFPLNVVAFIRRAPGFPELHP